ncbi:hypothetical protein [Streptomyces sp. NBC_01361]|uniref:hypothetical protein n=1 Tax=Streptomyces sp. NBC_01361 TaxID=2903838 RepID=UPI002E312594|nr:hypothetical protein [Streptomyces sp. NBC_01361]
MNDGHVSARRTVRPRVVGVNGQVPRAPHPDDGAAIRSNMPNIRPFAPSPQVTDPGRIVRSAARRAQQNPQNRPARSVRRSTAQTPARDQREYPAEQSHQPRDQQPQDERSSLLARRPTGAWKTELVGGVLYFYGEFDERDIATAERTYPGRRALINRANDLEVHPGDTGPARSVLDAAAGMGGPQPSPVSMPGSNHGPDHEP